MTIDCQILREFFMYIQCLFVAPVGEDLEIKSYAFSTFLYVPAPGFLFFLALCSKNPIFLSLPPEYLVDDHIYFSIDSLILYVAGDGFKFCAVGLNLGKFDLEILQISVRSFIFSRFTPVYLSGDGTAMS